MRLLFFSSATILIFNVLLTIVAPPALAADEFTCSTDTGTVDGNKVTFVVHVSDLTRYAELEPLLQYLPDTTQDRRFDPGPTIAPDDPNDHEPPVAGTITYTFSDLTHPPEEYTYILNNPDTTRSGSTNPVPCTGATTVDTGQTDVHPGGGTTDGPSAPNPDPVTEPEEEPKDPCEGKTGADKASCVEEKECDTDDNREEGRVFARAFNNACVTLPEFINTLVNYAMMFASIVAGFMFLQGGIKIIASRGNPAAVVEARSTLINAGVGLVLLATAYVVITFLSDAFGYGVTEDINLLGPFVP